MNKLPNWILTKGSPAFYDSESATAIEMVAKIYGKMNELIEEYNVFVDSVNSNINEFMTTTSNENEVFRVDLRQEFQDFIDTVNLKIQDLESDINAFYNEANRIFDVQNNRIANAENYMKNNIFSTTEKVVNEALANETITANLNYDANTKALTLNIGGV